jgi:hypothetical protein
MLNEPLPEVLRRSHLVGTMLVAEGGRVESLPPVLPELDLVTSGRALSALGARYVVLHAPLYPPDRARVALRVVRAALGPETLVTDDARHVWRLPEVPARVPGATP